MTATARFALVPRNTDVKEAGFFESVETRNAMLAMVQQRYDYIPTFDSRLSDGLDFYDISIWGLEELLASAYAAGKAAGQASK